MGLAIEVGAFRLREDDPEAVAYLRGQLEAVNHHLEAAGLPSHHEPDNIDTSKLLALEMFGYSGLHYLRRIAVYLDAGRDLPAPGDDRASKDPLMERFYQQVEEHSDGLLNRLLGRRSSFRRGFDHLLLHSDAEGFYVPVDFSEVIFAPDDEVAGGMIGSSQRLQAECHRLVDVLRVPPDIDPEANELWEAADAQGQAPDGWKRFGVEAFTGVRLLRAAERSLALGAAIVFC